MTPANIDAQASLAAKVAAVSWYHTVDLGNGLVTPGQYDHRPYLDRYGLPESLEGKTALDLGTASGYFAFELERRGARVTATDLPAWYDHDFGPKYEIDQSSEELKSYLTEPFEIARAARGSQVDKKFINIYDVSPQTVGEHDFVFCGSLLIHLSDPIRALWNVASVTRGKAIIATVIKPDEMERPIAELVGYRNADSWWEPSRRCLELMTAAAGFAGIEWFDDFRLDYSDGTPGPYHGIIHAYKTTAGWTPGTRSSQEIIEEQKQQTAAGQEQAQAERRRLAELHEEVGRLRDEVDGLRRRKAIRLMDKLRRK